MMKKSIKIYRYNKSVAYLRCTFRNIRKIRCSASRALSLIFQLFYKIILAIYSRALKLVCRTADLESILEACRFSHYILCIIIMTIMRVYDRSAATDMFHTLSRLVLSALQFGIGECVALSSFAGISHVCNFFFPVHQFSAKTNYQVLLPYYIWELLPGAPLALGWKMIPIAFTHFCNNVQTCSYVMLSLIKLLMRCEIVLLYAKYRLV